MLGIGLDGPLGPVPAEPADARGEDEGGDGTSGSKLSALSGERAALAVLVSVDGLGPMTLGRLVAAAGSALAVIGMARARDGERAIGALGVSERWEGPRIESSLPARIVRAAIDEHRILDGILGADVQVMILSDRAYPARLRAIALPPHVLFVRGDQAALSAPRMIAIVGTRRPSLTGRALAARIGRSMVRAGAAVASGLALGVDGAAHEAVIGEGGLTVAVIGGGHARLYPAAHACLASAIVQTGGAIVSEMAPDVAATRGTFPRRNRLISGLSEATVVVEAPARSGALTTAAWALEQGRGCFLVPGGLDAPQSAGCLAFLREASGEARIVAGVPELLDDLGLSGAAGLPGAAGHPARAVEADGRRDRPPGTFLARGPSREAVLGTLEPTPRRIADCLLSGATTVDELVAATDLPIAAVLGALTRLESARLVSGAYGRYAPIGALAA